VQSLVLLVGSQPTQQHRVWTSVVDLKRVHAALEWLRINNPLYKDIPVYTLGDIENKIAQQLDGQPSATSSTDTKLLKKLNEASRSYLYKNFSVQPLSSDYPADVLVDYQMDKVHGQSTDMFDAELDLKAFPELFPTGEHGMKDTKKARKSERVNTSRVVFSTKIRDSDLTLTTCFTAFKSKRCQTCATALVTCLGQSPNKTYQLSSSSNDYKTETAKFSPRCSA